MKAWLTQNDQESIKNYVLYFRTNPICSAIKMQYKILHRIALLCTTLLRKNQSEFTTGYDPTFVCSSTILFLAVVLLQ